MSAPEHKMRGPIMVETEVDIAVVGCGPVGLAAGIALSASGYRVALIGPSARSGDERTSALLDGAITFLKQIGVWDVLEPSSAPLRRLRIVDATDRLIRAPEVCFDSTEIELDAFGYNIPNACLVTALETAISRSDIIRMSVTAVDISLAADAASIVLSDATSVKARLVVGADGRRSAVRTAAGIAVQEWDYDQSALVATLAHTLPHDDTSTEFHTPTGPFTLVPLPGNRSSLVWVGSNAETSLRAGLTDDDLAAEIESRSASILGAIEIDGKRQVFPLAGMTARRFAGIRSVLIGEAAHVFPPIGAQGLNLGYRDVGTLAELMAGPFADPGTADRLAAFDRARRADIVSRTAAVDTLNRMLLSDLLPIQGIRGFGLFLLDRLPPLRRVVMQHGVARV